MAGPEAHPINYRIPVEASASRANRAHWLEAERRAARQVLFTRGTPPLNVCGGYRFPGAPTIDLRPAPATSGALAMPVGDTLDIPDFLKREG